MGDSRVLLSADRDGVCVGAGAVVRGQLGGGPRRAALGLAAVGEARPVLRRLGQLAQVVMRAAQEAGVGVGVGHVAGVRGVNGGMESAQVVLVQSGLRAGHPLEVLALRTCAGGQTEHAHCPTHPFRWSGELQATQWAILCQGYQETHISIISTSINISIRPL